MASQTLAAALLELALRVHRRVSAAGRDRGDVPGWVLVTIMTAGLVTALWVIADDQLKRILENALSGVTGP